ncbi:MAG: hypothetical protein KDC19_13970, partial [Saprospiraceae bacterium]|nr:hypothetical protein [Saprospiraceae bacterium]
TAIADLLDRDLTGPVVRGVQAEWHKDTKKEKEKQTIAHHGPKIEIAADITVKNPGCWVLSP